MKTYYTYLVEIYTKTGRTYYEEGRLILVDGDSVLDKIEWLMSVTYKDALRYSLLELNEASV